MISTSPRSRGKRAFYRGAFFALSLAALCDWAPATNGRGRDL